MPTYQAGLLQAQAYRALTQFVSNALHAYDVSMSEWALVGIVRDANVVRPTELAQHLAVRPPVVSKMIKSLQARKWLSLDADPSDDRMRLVTLTPTGVTRVDKIERNLRMQMLAFMSDVSAAELSGYLQTLAKLAAKITTEKLS